MTLLNIIVACDEQFGIGKNNTIPWYNKEDLKHFYNYTKGSCVIMGRKTWDSIPNKPLKERENIVLSRSLISDKCKVFRDIDEIMDYIKKYNTVWIIGGSEIYNLFLNRKIDYIYITIQNGVYNCDTFFPNILDYEEIETKSLNEYSTLHIYKSK
jgi:dihydrofolate reductase|tara:strand:+ start:243 stop:707 length:465 start_codon:yes stop_codon:yes gene_type:complete